MAQDWTEFKSWMASSVVADVPLQITLLNGGSIILYHPLHFGDTFVAGGDTERKGGGRSAVPYRAIACVAGLRSSS
jgi:hypothetical protein